MVNGHCPSDPKTSLAKNGSLVCPGILPGKKEADELVAISEECLMKLRHRPSAPNRVVEPTLPATAKSLPSRTVPRAGCRVCA